MGTHVSHTDSVRRLKRAEGHLKSIITTLEEERPGMDIARPFQAVGIAIDNAERCCCMIVSIIAPERLPGSVTQCGRGRPRIRGYHHIYESPVKCSTPLFSVDKEGPGQPALRVSFR